MNTTVIDPQYIFSNKHFKAIALEPPDYSPGSWTGAGNVVIDPASGDFILSSRLRKAENRARGYTACIYRSKNGENFNYVSEVTKEDIITQSGLDVHSLEGVQLHKDPATGHWYFFISINTDTDFTWGGLQWQTALMQAERLEGPWKYVDVILKNDRWYDRHHARDISIDIVNEDWLCLYKARDAEHVARVGFATSTDGISWNKQGTFTLDGEDRHFWVSGKILPTTSDPIFIGLEKMEDVVASEQDVVTYDQQSVGHGGGPPRNFVAYSLDIRNRNFKTLFRSPWVAGSQYEHKQHPVLGYSTLVEDKANKRILIYVEAIGPESEQMGLNETIERVLVYEVPLNEQEY